MAKPKSWKMKIHPQIQMLDRMQSLHLKLTSLQTGDHISEEPLGSRYIQFQKLLQFDIHQCKKDNRNTWKKKNFKSDEEHLYRHILFKKRSLKKL